MKKAVLFFLAVLFLFPAIPQAKKISEYEALTGSNLAADDLFIVDDMSEPDDADKVKNITAAELTAGIVGKNIIPIGRYSGDLDAAVAALDVVGNSGESFVIVIDQATSMSGDVDLSSLSNAASIMLAFLSPAGVITTSSNALTLAQQIPNSVTWQIFSGTGVAFTAGSFDFVRASWWTTNSTPGTTDMTDAIEAAIAALPSTGGTVRITGLNRITNQISIPYLVNLEGETRGYGLITSGYSNTPINATIYADGCDGLLYAAPYTSGFSTIRNLNVRGETGGYVGIKILAYDVSLENVSVHGFLDGIGIWADYVCRFKWQNLQIQACGLGMYFVQYVQAGEIDGVVIENCTAGIYAMAGPFNGLTINNATIESIGTGTASTSFPGTGLFTADATMLTDLGKTQATLEGAMFFKYLTGNIRGQIYPLAGTITLGSSSGGFSDIYACNGWRFHKETIYNAIQLFYGASQYFALQPSAGSGDRGTLWTGDVRYEGALTNTSWTKDFSEYNKADLLKTIVDAYRQHDGNALHPLLKVDVKDPFVNKIKSGKNIDDILQLVVEILHEHITE